jgi:scyllo-inositol 2-dehydrogenase (NADP+)
MIKVGIIGFGLSGRYLQAPFFESHAAFQLHTIATSQADVQAAYPQVRHVTNWESMLDDPTIDLISITSPNETHLEYARRCILAGKHVLVEKPLCATASEASSLVELAKKHKKHLFVYQNRRFDSDFLTIQQLLVSGRLGQLLRWEARFDRFKPTRNVKVWKETPTATSGIWYDLGAHLLDQCIAMFGTPDSVQGRVFSQRPESQVDDAFDVLLQFGPMTAQLSATMLARYEGPRYILHGTEGTYVKFGIDIQEDQLKAGWLPDQEGYGVEPAEHRSIFYDNDRQAHPIPVVAGRWMTLYDNMADVILSGATPLIPLEQIVAQVGVLAQVSNSSHNIYRVPPDFCVVGTTLIRGTRF